MSRIDGLIRNHCPNGVVFRALWELTTWDKKFNAVDRQKQPKVLKYRYLLASEITPLVREVGDVKVLTTHTSDLWTNEELSRDWIRDAEVVCIPWGGNPNVQYYKGRFVTSDNRIAVVNNPTILETKFLYYYLLSQIDLIGTFYRGSGIAHPEMAKVLDMRIPTPPIEVQREIVRVLDTFRALDAELRAELEARLQQQIYYRDSLFMKAFQTNEAKKLGEVGQIFRGRRFVKDDICSTGVPAIHYGEIYTKYTISASKTFSFVTEKIAAKLRFAKPGDVILVSAGETIEDIGKSVAWLGSTDVVIHDALYGFRSPLDAQYVSHFFSSTPFKTQLRRHISTSKISAISPLGLAEVAIPIPPHAEQKRIAEALNNLEQLVTDLSVGLPAELVARHQQYEYYRARLLSFEAVA